MPSPKKSSKDAHLDTLTLSLMVDDVLPLHQSEQCLAHIHQCKQCEQAFDDLQAMAFAMVKMKEVDVPPDFAQSVLAKLPPQDAVDNSKAIAIEEYRVKSNPFASMPWQQIACVAACAVLAWSFLPSPDTMVTPDDTSSGMMRTVPDTDTPSLIQQHDSTPEDNQELLVTMSEDDVGLAVSSAFYGDMTTLLLPTSHGAIDVLLHSTMEHRFDTTVTTTLCDSLEVAPTLILSVEGSPHLTQEPWTTIDTQEDLCYLLLSSTHPEYTNFCQWVSEIFSINLSAMPEEGTLLVITPS